MMLLRWSFVFICLCVGAEDVAVCREPGQNVSFKCSSDGCPSSIDGFAGMYLYHYFASREEVLYFHAHPGPAKITKRSQYKTRVQQEGSLTNHTITIRNLNVNDSGLYRCVYTKFPSIEVNCSVYTLVVREGPSVMPPTTEKCPPLVLIIIGTFLTGALLSMIFTMMIILRVKQLANNRRRTGNSSRAAPSEYVYEVMTKDGLRPFAPPQ
ncbi:hypothetical protein Q5P01_025063 [Channa striata]|uniref:Immunoglobulin domain-containing protein n=1 Tax=Channa striata TaxID=64152 RepID=A0AA88LPD3_CHASR|nr:hypothetical protein Q5P01_025063 [Channa striata]